MKHETGAVLFTVNLKSLATFYERVVGMRVATTADDHISLETGSFRLTVHAIPERHAKNIKIKTPPVIREAAAVKMAFRVKDIAQARAIAAQLGGAVYADDREWRYEGNTICDGYDPDGNVFQLWQGRQAQARIKQRSLMS
jgi:predicted enzyme related to lactoylglutathione lyase